MKNQTKKAHNQFLFSLLIGDNQGLLCESLAAIGSFNLEAVQKILPDVVIFIENMTKRGIHTDDYKSLVVS